MLKKIGLAVVALVAVLVLVVATRPGEYRVERSAVVAAPAEALFGAVADFHRWDAWSPWARLDPAMKTEYGGAPGAIGSTYYWLGNDKVGEGRMTVLAVAPPRRVEVKLEFLKPWASTNLTTFDLAPEGAGTKVTWAMSGKLDFLGKAMTLFMEMDKAIGPDFERGLAALKAGAEAAATPR
jgi:uncharacterized protein YndB with AHSA1/START domain